MRQVNTLFLSLVTIVVHPQHPIQRTNADVKITRSRVLRPGFSQICPALLLWQAQLAPGPCSRAQSFQVNHTCCSGAGKGSKEAEIGYGALLAPQPFPAWGKWTICSFTRTVSSWYKMWVRFLHSEQEQRSLLSYMVIDQTCNE